MLTYYVTPTATNSGAGTQKNPVDLLTALSWCKSGDTVVLGDGIYTHSATTPLAMPAGATIQGVGRPIITHADGYPPAVSVENGAKVRGVWFGGARPSTSEGARTVQMGVGGTMEDCTLFNYCNGIMCGSDAFGNTFNRIRFVTCGFGFYSHPIYIASINANEESEGNHASDLIVVGGGGYGIHLYHEPSYSWAKYGFAGHLSNGLACEGDSDGPVEVSDFVVWRVKAGGFPLYYSLDLGHCDRNLWFGLEAPETVPVPGPTPNPPDPTFDSNYFMAGKPTAGSNPITITEAQMQTMLGHTIAEIDAACDALEASVTADVATIHADETMEKNFAILADVIAHWRAK